ncbi:MAG: exodeoxyribonuclease VII small subunit [Defluviitaleaceae bacterium]|nr:exodeoxyribonuclease VII small subunit [Defluviitaleaceae bacterium]
MDKNQTNQTYEQALARLQEIAQTLENSETPLTKVMELYKESMDLFVFCKEKLDSFEGEVALLRKNAEGNFEKDSWNEN